MQLRSREDGSAVPAVRGLFKYHALSLKIALFAGSVGTAAGVVFLLIAGLDWLVPVLWLVVVTFAAAYLGANYFLYERIALARTVLRRTRKYKFRKLKKADYPKGDELNELIRQVYRTGQVLEREIRQLRRVANYRRAFIGDVSHELKTPIFAIQGYAETLLEGAIDDSEVNRAFLEKIIRNAERLGALTADLTEISRIETGELQMSMAPFRLPSLVHDITDSLEPLAARRRIQMQAGVARDLPPVMGDEQRIRQVIVNLLDNAIKYTDTGGSVGIAVERTGDGAVSVSVTDTGIGIPKKHIPRITERFFRVDKSRSRSAGGTGLGLAIVKHILAAHSQKLQVASTEGVGSTFRFILPVAPEASEIVD